MPAEYVIDAQRAGEALYEFIRRRKYELVHGVDGEVLEFGHNKLVDDLCRRIADDVGLKLEAEPRALRALLSARLMVFLANTTTDPEAELLRLPAAPTQQALLALLFRRFIAKVRLPRDWNGKPYSSQPGR